MSLETSLRNYFSPYLIGMLLVSFGISTVTVGGSWDITNHLLNKPETFASAPHAVMYSGVALSLIGTIISFFGLRKIKNNNSLRISVKVAIIGILTLLCAGPFDFVWHSNFGLDGLLSPPHMSLIIGMILASTGAMIGIIRYAKLENKSKISSNFLQVIGLLPIWLASSGMISSLSLPFSHTDYFNFNPDPLIAVLVATSAYPFLISLFLLTINELSKNRFGILTFLGSLFLIIYGSTAILPNLAISETVVFYTINLIPLFVADFILSKSELKHAKYLASVILGSTFYMFYYPYIMYTYNEFLLGKLVSPSMIYGVYFEMIRQVFFLTIVPAMLFAVLGCYFSRRICKTIVS